MYLIACFLLQYFLDVGLGMLKASPTNCNMNILHYKNYEFYGKLSFLHSGHSIYTSWHRYFFLFQLSLNSWNISRFEFFVHSKGKSDWQLFHFMIQHYRFKFPCVDWNDNLTMQLNASYDTMTGIYRSYIHQVIVHMLIYMLLVSTYNISDPVLC